MAESDYKSDYEEFWDELLRDAEVSGEPQRASFFRMYAELAAENGDCADLVYCPIIREGSRPYQVDGYALDRDRGELHIAVCDFRPEREIQNLNADGINAIFNRVRRFCEYAVKKRISEGTRRSEFRVRACMVHSGKRELHKANSMRNVFKCTPGYAKENT